MTFDRLNKIPDPTLAQVRAFLFHVVYMIDTFAGDGYTYNHRRERVRKQYMTQNIPLSRMTDYQLIDLRIELPIETQPKENDE